MKQGQGGCDVYTEMVLMASVCRMPLPVLLCSILARCSLHCRPHSTDKWVYAFCLLLIAMRSQFIVMQICVCICACRAGLCLYLRLDARL